MKELLISEIISHRTRFDTRIRLINQHVWGEQDANTELLKELIEECKNAIATTEDNLEKAELFLDCLYRDLLFVENEQLLWRTQDFHLEGALAARRIAPALKLMLVEYIARACDFEADIVFVPNSYMVRILCDSEYAIIFDVVTGEAINWLELDRRMNEVEGNPREVYLYAESAQTMLGHYLTQLKDSAIREQSYELAFKCIEIMSALANKSGKTMQDSGLLLHSSDCFKLAYDDFRSYEKKVKTQPSDALLQLALKKLDTKETSFH